MYFLRSKETVLSLKYVYAINSSIAFSQKAQLEIAPSNRVAGYYDLKPLVHVSFNLLQLSNDRVSRACCSRVSLTVHRKAVIEKWTPTEGKSRAIH